MVLQELTGPDGCEVRVTVRARAADLDAEVLSLLQERLRRPRVVLERRGDELVDLTFVHSSPDLWISMLETMSAAWAAGYEPVGLTARVADLQQHQETDPG